jgi:hypothetical protein
MIVGIKLNGDVAEKKNAKLWPLAVIIKGLHTILKILVYEF